MKHIIFTLFLILAMANLAEAQRFETIAKLPTELHENSGLLNFGDSVLCFINDGGNAPTVYLYFPQNGDLEELSFAGTAVSNEDWEDLAKDDSNNVYIADIGNNSNNRNNLVIYKMSNPLTSLEPLSATSITFTYQNQFDFPPANEDLNFDAEALVWHQDSLYIFTKNRTSPYDGWTYMYVLPDEPGSYVAELRDSIQFSAAFKELSWITGADVLNDTLVLLSSGKLWILPDFDAMPLHMQTPIELDLNGITQKEAICFKGNTASCYISDEEFSGIGRNLYQLSNAFAHVPLPSGGPSIAIGPQGIYLRNSAKNWMVEAHGVLGHQVKHGRLTSKQGFITTSLGPGLYVISLRNGEEVYHFNYVKTE